MQEIRTGETSPFLNIMINFDMFSRLSPGTMVRLDSDGLFIISGGDASYLPYAQYIANYYNSYSTEKLVEDLNDFAKKIDLALKTELDKIVKNKTHVIKLISLVLKEFKFAYNGICDIDGGMRGLVVTYNKDPCLPLLISALENMKKTMCKYKNAIDEFDNASSLYCAESEFGDKEWIEAMRIIPLLQKECAGIYKYYISYSGGLAMRRLFAGGSDQLCNEICGFNGGGGIYLGDLPLVGSNRDDLVTIKELGIQSVLSVCEVFENNSPGYIYSPITPQDWRKRYPDVYHYQIPCANYSQMELELVQKGVEFIRWNILHNRKIYVHCAGTNRSLVVVIAFLVEYYDYTVDDAVAYVYTRRSQVTISTTSKKMNLLKRIESFVKSKK